MIYEFKAENLTRPQAVKLVRELEDKGVEVEHADMDAWFTNHALLVITCADEAAAKKVRDRIWELNQGLCCDMHIITETQLKAYIGD
jgi:hypothetical protein